MDSRTGKRNTPVFEPECDQCHYIGTFPARYHPEKEFDLYLSHDHEIGSKFLIQTGPPRTGEYYTTDDPESYLLGFERSYA